MRTGSNTGAIVVMAKAPIAGVVKTRLSPALTPEEAASLACCLVQDTVNNMEILAASLFVAYTPAGREVLEAILPARLRWIEQSGADLGERMASAITTAAESGFSPIILVGADSPHLPSEYVGIALEALSRDRAGVVLGPTEDGGYYLVGVRGPAPGLFAGVRWSSSRAYADTAANADRLRLRLLRLPEWYDVDTPFDLRRLRDAVVSDRISRTRIPNTACWLDRHNIRGEA